MEHLILELDAGHGKDTAGKRSPDGSLREWYFNSDVAARVESKLKAYKNVTVHRLYDPNGSDVPLSTRTNKANAGKSSSANNCTVSIHANAFGSGGWNAAYGIETFSYNGNNGYQKGGESLAKVLQRHLVKETGLHDRGAKKANLHMVREPHMDAALVECGFMTNREENELLKSSAYREKCANAIVAALVEHYGLVKGNGSSAPSKGGSAPSKPAPAPANKAVSIVDYLKSIGEDAGFNNRSRLAAQYGISGYTGTAAQNTKLLEKLKKGAAPTKTAKGNYGGGDKKTSSVVDYLKSIGQGSGFDNRAKIAKELGISGYKGTAAQNDKLLELMRGGASAKPANKYAGGDKHTYSVVDYLKSIKQSSSFENRAKIAKELGMSGYKGTASQNTKLLDLMRK